MNLYIIPAYGETIRNKGYKKIIEIAKQQQYDIHILNLQIKGKNISNLINSAIKKIGEDSIIFGFSTGALLAYILSTKIPMRKIILASVSPLLGTDIKHLQKEVNKFFGKKTTQELNTMTYGKSLAKKAVFLYGQKEVGEGDMLIKRTKNLHKKFKGKKSLIVISNTDHELNDAYIEKITKNL